MCRREPNGGGINGGGRFIKFHVAATTVVASNRCTNVFVLTNSATPIYATPIYATPIWLLPNVFS